ncbi:peptidoglycan D,D-transpeptidase FtsI family protein [Gluconobacter oxydans]|uniref:Transpeptidase FtsI n=3 Tax=Gluconobacter oxydans TaxID=442 RepID=Q5FUK1_GLUOX|nr:penicillin-binding protein 2 [Gluconobacter oxydans]AAW59945.1 Transpeptidase FtsI [Gluconobacter oxydans 621H]MBF0855131.1 penicillin-binding protein 2 [Gluconobacter oxydans]TCW29317.1 cell division protein FtsI (penicillin-binding protein 3) [Gluconobacter oxydans]GEC60889.1 penicillin-binding protein [Gluconobacter oxydans]
MPQDVPPSSGSQRPERPDVPSGRFRRGGTPRGFRRLNLDQMHGRLLGVGMGFLAIYGAVALKATVATVLMPMEPEKRQIAPQVPEIPKSDPRGEMSGDFVLPTVKRATITDRTGQALALSLPVAQVYANPMELIDPADAADKLRKVLPQLDRDETIRRLSLKKQFVYLARDISPVQEIAINNLGIPGIYFEAGERRHYPLGRTAAQIMGSVDIDDHGIAGVERYFDKRLNSDRTPLRLSLDVRVQTVAHDELQAAKDEFSAIGASAIVMDVRTGEILAMVSLPDYDANDFGHAPNDARFNRAVTGMYEPGSTFKLQTAAMGLQLGIVHLWDRFSTIPIKVGRFTIRDMKTDHFAPWLSLPGVLAYSSNPAAAHIALDVGATRQQDWLRNMGFFNRVPVELPEAGRPLVPASRNWGISTVMTVGFGHGVAEPPLAIVRGTAATVNGGILLKPTLVARDTEDDSKSAPDADAAQVRPVAYRPGTDTDEIGAETPVGTRVLSEQTSALLRKLLRLDVTMGSGKSAEVPGYYVGGKTGTAEKIGAHGGYLKHVNVSAFTSVFPMNNPHYAVYVMLDSPQGTVATHGWTTAAWNAAPTVKKIISRVGPILNQFPDLANKDAIDASLAIPMNPPVPPGYRALGPGNDPGDPRNQARASKTPTSRTQH